MPSKNIHFLTEHHGLIEDPNLQESVREGLKAGQVFIAKNVFPEEWVASLTKYLTSVGQCSLPNYQPIEVGAPNFHRMNNDDPRAYVKGRFHQFSFFPWNQDYFQLFEKVRSIYWVKNLLTKNDRDRFLSATPTEDCVARLSFQFYPRGGGFLNRHQDPVDRHQLTVPILNMSEKGRDFLKGGLFVEVNEERIYLDEHAGPGDVIYFSPHITHGVESIDPEEKLDWLSFQGRWMLLFATNKIAGSDSIQDAKDLDSGTN